MANISNDLEDSGAVPVTARRAFYAKPVIWCVPIAAENGATHINVETFRLSGRSLRAGLALWIEPVQLPYKQIHQRDSL